MIFKYPKPPGHYSHALFSLAFLISNPSMSAPSISSIDGNISTNETITINGSGFTSKANPAPLFWWDADDGSAPSILGRMTTWGNDNQFIGTASSTIVAPGSNQSYFIDHGATEGAALGQVDYNSDRVYIFRKTYEDFDITTDYARVTRIDTETGTISQGDVVTGSVSGATGIVQGVIDAWGNRYIYYESIGGTINDGTPKDFVFDETLTGPSGTAHNIQPDGLFRTFNFKTFRFWVTIGGITNNNTHLNSQGRDNDQLRITPEYTDGTLWNESFDNPLTQLPNAWKTEEVEYKTSDIDTANGIWRYYLNGLVSSKLDSFINRDSARPEKYRLVVQSQVSNGAQPNSSMHYDSLYVDDTWHRVLLCSSTRLSECTDREIQIPSSWSDNQITIQLNTGGLDMTQPIYLYVIDENGEANLEGYNLCPTCPSPPSNLGIN